MLTSSVAMCTFNGGKYLGEQLESILGGTRLPDEIVIHDDVSTDNTADIVAEFQRRSPVPIHFKVNERRLGSNINFARSITACSQDVIFLADQDDVWLTDKLETFMSEFEREPDVGSIFSDAEIVDANLEKLGVTMFSELAVTGDFQKLNNASLLDVTHRPIVTGATMAFRRTLVDLILPIPQSPYLVHDQWIAAIAASATRLSYFMKPYVLYRQHNQQQLGRPKESSKVAGKNGRQGALETMVGVYRTFSIPILHRLGAVSASQAVQDLTAALHHCETRLALPALRPARLATVLQELIKGSYHRYSNGVRSAIRDLVET